MGIDIIKLCLAVFIILVAPINGRLHGQAAHGRQVRGEVRSATEGMPLSGVSVKLKESQQSTVTDADGQFRLTVNADSGILQLTHVGFGEHEVTFGRTDQKLTVGLRPSENTLEEVEVLSTGYYQIPKERATGSFDFIGQADLNRFPSTNLLDRLDGVVNGLTMDRSHYSGERQGEPKLRLRGLSTIESESEPLIILDGFAYGGDLSMINPSDIENITVLKDAAAASIWGARAGNGVLVITTKKGTQNQATRLTFSSQQQIQEKPDLFYGSGYLPSATVLDIEEEMFL